MKEDKDYRKRWEEFARKLEIKFPTKEEIDEIYHIYINNSDKYSKRLTKSKKRRFHR